MRGLGGGWDEESHDDDQTPLAFILTPEWQILGKRNNCSNSKWLFWIYCFGFWNVL